MGKDLAGVKKDETDPLVLVIAQSCQIVSIKRANAALPQFQIEHAVPDQMMDLLNQLDEASNGKATELEN